MVASTAFSAPPGWSVCPGIRWSISRGIGGQFAPESGGQYQRILHFSNQTQQMHTTKGTLFGAYNAITGYHQNIKAYKSEEIKLNSILFGAGLNKTQTAFNLCKVLR